MIFAILPNSNDNTTNNDSSNNIDDPNDIIVILERRDLMCNSNDNGYRAFSLVVDIVNG